MADNEIVKYADPRVLFLSREVQKYTIAVAPLDTPLGQGSGTCVRVGGRFFVATAAHVIGDYPDRPYAMITPASQGRTPRILRGGKRGGGPRDDLDIGWLELEPHATSPMERHFLDLARLAPYWDGGGKALRVCGVPVEGAERGDREGTPFYRPHMQDLPTRILSNDEVGFKIDAPRRIYVDWPKYIDAHNNDIEEFPLPSGISGGGLWALNLSEHDEWKPEQSQLIGIEFATDKSNLRRYLICQKIHLWLEMMAEDIPELASTINEHLNGSKLVLPRPQSPGNTPDEHQDQEPTAGGENESADATT
jgi:hypothetical protein